MSAQIDSFWMRQKHTSHWLVGLLLSAYIIVGANTVHAQVDTVGTRHLDFGGYGGSPRDVALDADGDVYVGGAA